MRLAKVGVLLGCALCVIAEAQGQSPEIISVNGKSRHFAATPAFRGWPKRRQCCPSPQLIVEPADPTKPTAPTKPDDTTPPDITEPPVGDFTQSPPAGTAGAESFMPQMIGDLGGYLACRQVFVPTTVTTVTTTTFAPLPANDNGPGIVPPPTTTVTTDTALFPVKVIDPVAARAGSGIKIADNASPRPVDRIFYTYNYFAGLGGRGGTRSGASFVDIVTTPNSTIKTTTTIPNITLAGRSLYLHRHLIGFEKTFLSGNASVECRFPYFHSGGNEDVGADDFGDISCGLKYALVNDPRTKDVFSVGLLMTAPTGPGIRTIDNTINSWLFQPWVGWIFNVDSLYVHAFHSLLVPTEAEDIVALFNDVGVGYALYQSDFNDGRILNSVIPTFEVHITTPLENRNGSSLLQIPDIVALTGGVHFGFGGPHLFTVGVVTPVTGPSPYDIEAAAQLNLRF